MWGIPCKIPKSHNVRESQAILHELSTRVEYIIKKDFCQEAIPTRERRLIVGK